MDENKKKRKKKTKEEPVPEVTPEPVEKKGRSRKKGKEEPIPEIELEPTGKKGKRKTALKAAKPKKKRVWLKFAIIFFVIVLLGGAVFVTYHFNLFALREKFFETMYTLDPNYKEVEILREEVVKRSETLNEREDELDIEESRLKERSSALDAREITIKLREEELDELSTAPPLPIYRQPLSETELADMLSLAKIYARMEPETAATIISTLYSLEDMTAILYHMSESAASSILSVMEVGLAADITYNLLHY